MTPKPFPIKRQWVALVGVILAALVFPATVFAHGPVSGGVSNDVFNDLFTTMMWIATPIFLIVEILLLFAIIRYRRRSHDEMPKQVHGNTPLELSWTIGGFVVIAVVFVLGYQVMRENKLVSAGPETEFTPDLTIHVNGYMFNWDYEYFLADGDETGVMTTRDLYIPANKNVLLEIESKDVQHSFWVPKLAGKVDAVPGYTNTMLLNVDKTGTYEGQCAEYCGLNHYAMLINVHVMDPAEFDAWLSDQVVQESEFQPVGTDLSVELPNGNSDEGEQLVYDLGCTACHADNKDQPSGPAFQRMSMDAHHVEGYSPEQYLHESIVLPCEQLTEGYDQCIMPQDYGERMDADDLADVIAYITAVGQYEPGPQPGPRK
ncbi:cytochrome c oxidase subunit II [Aggregatilinea lenta]|uniref:cytochrome c oxidase subunit II n=1 Tax=Aggregatilinea lenta TaxID=913108 RepID=UPI000E5A562A|nr:cytochrome c oxidase subunit II [Aggregatilinea lenta]